MMCTVGYTKPSLLAINSSISSKPLKFGCCCWVISAGGMTLYTLTEEHCSLAQSSLPDKGNSQVSRTQRFAASLE
eukprot:1084265-Pelagomonas_calceolata.AAC.5